jgi:predicted lipoprotein with Yx(FWY)xxD motif
MIAMLWRRSAAPWIRVATAAGSIAAVSHLIAACGGAATNRGSTSGAAEKGSPVAAIRVGGLSVLADTARMPLYSPMQEASGQILCTGACTQIWKPVPAGTDTGSAKVAGKLGVVMRPDGTRQLTAGGRPLYTFVGDSPGQLKGNGLVDQFNGHHFTWQAVLSSGAVASRGAGSTSTSSGSATYGYRSPY